MVITYETLLDTHSHLWIVLVTVLLQQLHSVEAHFFPNWASVNRFSGVPVAWHWRQLTVIANLNQLDNME